MRRSKWLLKKINTKKVVRFLIEPHDLFLYHYLTGVNRLTVNSRFFYSYTSKALELFTLRSSLNLLPRSQQLHGSLNYLVCLVPNLEVLAHIPNISCNKGFQLQGEVFLRLN